MEYTYRTTGVCAREISFNIDNGVISSVRFMGGCNGNLKAISKLVEGKDAKEIAGILKGNTCGMKQTSCADQLAIAIEKALSNQN
ncbi:MAG: TIGR03905 family TSCPD domain-containing protein [Clostridia bacterium]|nr:TIGR03905 family TSCPD domain-containing protein [Clostridia bacterium]